MNIAAVMDEIGVALDTIDGLRVHPWNRSKITPPAALVTLPSLVTYDQTYGRGSDRVELDVVVLVGKASDRASRDQIARYADGSGTHSVKAALEARTWTTCHEVTASECEFATYTVAGTDYLGAVFALVIHGQGA